MINKRNNNNYNNPNNIKVNICSLRRVTRVTKGGKVFKISVLVVVGDEKGRVGYGSGKSVEVIEAIKKASKRAQNNMMYVPLYKNRTIFHDVSTKFCSSKVLIKKAKEGVGIIAGGVMRNIFEVLGIKDIVCKSFGSSNHQNIVKATFKALKKIRTPKLLINIRKLDINFFNRSETNNFNNIKDFKIENSQIRNNDIF